MKGVSSASKESYKNMTELENILEEFKTKEKVEDVVKETDEENTIATAVSQELLEAIEAEPADSEKEEVIFDLDEVEEYIPD